MWLGINTENTIENNFVYTSSGESLPFKIGQLGTIGYGDCVIFDDNPTYTFSTTEKKYKWQKLSCYNFHPFINKNSYKALPAPF